MKVFTAVLTLILAMVVSIEAGSRRRAPELTPSCMDASRVRLFRTSGNIGKFLTFFDKTRDLTGQASRNINWDGAAVKDRISNDRAELPGDIFLNGAGFRQIIFSEPLTAATDSFRGLFNDEDIGADPFSNDINVAPLTRNKVVVSFTMEDRKTAGLVAGFGAILTDVESNFKSGLAFYDAAGDLLKVVYAKKAASGAHQFVGAIFDESVVASVEIFLGDNGNLDSNKPEGYGNDFVAMDDWFFFLSDSEVPQVTYRGEVEERDDEILKQFEKRRDALAFGQSQNINWDGPAVKDKTNGGRAMLQRDIFLNGAGFRQLTIALQSEQPFASEDEFGFSGSGLKSFTDTVNFAPYANTLTIDFFLEDKSTRGLIHGFGAIFTDVELPLKSGLRAFDASGKVVANVRARPQKSGSHQFIGVMFNKPTIARIVLDMGDDENLPNNPEDLANQVDLVAVDDWLFFKSTTRA